MTARRRALVGVATALVLVGGFAASLKVSGGAEEAAAVATPEEQAAALIDQGVVHLEATTITYQQWLRRNYPPGVRETTEWFLAFAAFDEAKAVLSEEPPPTTTTTEPPTTSEPPPTTTEPPPTTTEPPPTTTAPPPDGEVLPPGASWDAAADGAPCGKVFLVTGSYPAQSIDGFRSCAGNPIVFQEDGQAIVDSISFRGSSDITVRGIATTYKGTDPGAGNQRGVWVGPSAGNDGFAAGSKRITLENIDAGSIDSWFATDLTVLGGDYGPCDAVTGSNVCGNNKQDLSRDVLIEGAYFHDLEYDPSAPGAHWECMYVNGGINVTIRSNRFERCAIFDLFATISGPDAGAVGHENLTIEGNYFAPATSGNGDPSRGWSSLSLSWCQNASQPSYRNVTIRGNTFGPFAGIERDLNADSAGCVWENVRVEENDLTWGGGCQNGWAYANNTWRPALNGTNGVCGPGDTQGG